MTDTTHADIPESRTIISASLPAILLGGPPKVGKSVLTYNLTCKLRDLDIPHYVFRASPDGEGDWFLKGNWDTVYQIHKQGKRDWSPIFRQLASQDVPKRQLPLLVDLGGHPREEDKCIFQACTHVILLLEEKDGPVARLWHSFIEENKLELIAEIYSQESGESLLRATQPIITGVMTKQSPQEPMRSAVFLVLLERIKQLFGKYTSEELERWHMSQAPQDFTPVNLHTWHNKLFPAARNPHTWDPTPRTLQRFLAQLPAQQPLAVYGRGPAWLYGALALHAPTQPFSQFDVRLGWKTPPSLSSGTPEQTSSVLKIDGPRIVDDTYIISFYPDYGYLDYPEEKQHSKAKPFVLPEPPAQGGVIIGGKLPLWFFTALARFYVQKDVAWIALNDAQDNRPVVIYSKDAAYPLGKKLDTYRV